MSNLKKSTFVFSKLSLSRLVGVSPKIESVVKRALELSEIDFMVVEGVRTKEQCYINYGKGRTASQCQAKNVPIKYAQPNLPKVTWLNNPLASQHVSGKAVDLVPFPVDWNDLSKFRVIANVMKAAAKELNIKISWGGDWETSKDYPHFELA